MPGRELAPGYLLLAVKESVAVHFRTRHFPGKPVHLEALANLLFVQLAVRAIAQKYLQFAKRLMEDTGFADTVAKF